MAAEPLVEPFEQWIPRIVPNSEPPDDPTVNYPGSGAVQLWSDVYHFGTSIVHYFGRHSGAVSYVTSTSLDEAVDSAVGATIKSLSGFINRAAQIGVSAQEWASMELDAMSANIGAIYQYFDDRVGRLESFERTMLDWFLPGIDARLNQLNAERFTDAAFNSAADRQWAVDHIFRPLQENIGAVESQIPVWSEGAYQRATQYTNDAVNHLGLNVLAGLAPLTAAVAALQTESEDCVQPMCETIGPKTDLGKLLKGLKLGAEIAALGAILNMTEGDLANLIGAVTSHLSGLVGDVEQFIQPGGETVAGLIARATADVV